MDQECPSARVPAVPAAGPCPSCALVGDGRRAVVEFREFPVRDAPGHAVLRRTLHAGFAPRAHDCSRERKDLGSVLRVAEDRRREYGSRPKKSEEDAVEAADRALIARVECESAVVHHMIYLVGVGSGDLGGPEVDLWSATL